MKHIGFRRTLLEPGSNKEAKYLNRIINWGVHGVRWESDPKRARTLLREFWDGGMQSTGDPSDKSGGNRAGTGQPLTGESASKTRRGVAIINYLSQDRPDLSVTARVLVQRMASPTEGTGMCLKRAIRYLSSHPRGLLIYPRDMVDQTLRIWTDSDWAGDVQSRKSCSGGYIQRNGGTIDH